MTYPSSLKYLCQKQSIQTVLVIQGYRFEEYFLSIYTCDSIEKS